MKPHCLGLLATLCLVAATQAQEPFRDWLKPRLGEMEASADYTAEHYFDENVEDQDTELGFTGHDLRLRVPLWQNDRHELSLGSRIKVLDVDTDAWFPGSSSPFRRDDFPDHLWDLRLDGTYRHKLDNGWIAGGHLSLGSPSDKPFASLDEVAVSASGFLRIPDGERNAWVFFLNYASNREFCPHIPLPGVAYQFEPDENFSALLGLPYTSLRWKPIDTVIVDASYFIPRTVRTRVSYLPVETVRLYVGYDWTNQRYLRHDRQDDDDRLFYYEQRVKGGVRWDLTEWLYVDLNGGYAFDRMFFEGERFDDRWDSRLDIGDGPFAAARVGIRL